MRDEQIHWIDRDEVNSALQHGIRLNPCFHEVYQDCGCRQKDHVFDSSVFICAEHRKNTIGGVDKGGWTRLRRK